MPSRFVFIPRQPWIATIGILLFTGATLFCAVLFSLSPVEAAVKDDSRTALMQTEPTLVPSTQTAATVFLPLDSPRIDQSCCCP
jgi:hypothetical protein